MSSEALGVYVHIPFCEVKCSYCHFAIDPRRPDAARQDRYLGALLTEIAGRARREPVDSIYFGGGTPTLVSLDRLARVLQALRGGFVVAAGAEVTVEANPRDLDAAGYAELVRHGVTRLSLGVQAFDDGVLAEMGRRHAAADAERAVAAARAAGFSGISIDLILGWPGETPERWQRALDGVARLRPDHISLYVLEVEGRTLLAHRQARGGLELPEEDSVAELYERSVGRFAALGLDRYEISNFARPGQQSRHNAKYWDDAPFLGFGLSAHSYVAGERSWNQPTFGGYCRGVEHAGADGARAGSRRLTPHERLGEALFTGLRRRDGVELAAFNRRHGVDPLERYADALARPLAAGLLEVCDGRLRLTDRGVLLSNEVFEAFV